MCGIFYKFQSFDESKVVKLLILFKTVRKRKQKRCKHPFTLHSIIMTVVP